MVSFPILPFTQPPTGTITLPGSKSITNRALILGALHSGTAYLQGALFSQDTSLMIEALRALGITINADEKYKLITIQGKSGNIPNAFASIQVGNAGTVARFLCAFVCIKQGGTFRFEGASAMEKRPIKELLDTLVKINAAEVVYHKIPGHFPFTIHSKGLQGNPATVDTSQSSQFLSALLMVSSEGKGIPIIEHTGNMVSEPFIQVTIKIMQAFGRGTVEHSRKYKTENKSIKSSEINYTIEPDYTAASYFLTLNHITKGSISLLNYTPKTSIQGDALFSEYLKNLKHQSVFDFKKISDTFMTLAAISPLLNSPITITGIAHTRIQETDRVHAVATELKRLGQIVHETENSLTIVQQPLKPALIQTYNDHRIAMSFAILGSYDAFKNGKPWLSMNNPSCCEKTYPNFFNTLNSLHHASKSIQGNNP